MVGLVLEICMQKDRQTDRQDRHSGQHNTPLPYWSRVCIKCRQVWRLLGTATAMARTET